MVNDDLGTLPMPPVLPDPALSVEAALADLRRYGVCLMTGVLDDAMLGRARAALYDAANRDRDEHVERKGFALDRDERNQRVWNLLNRDQVFVDLAQHPIAMRLVRETLGWPALLSNISGNITEPGSTEGVLHADQIFVPEPWPSEPQGINVTWCIDAFTSHNGATQVVVGSHLWHRCPTAADAQVPMVSVLAPAGSLFAFESRIWHRTGANRTVDQKRAAVFPFYTTPVYRTQENWFLSLDPVVRRTASDTLLTLLAYKSEGFGLVYGASPE